MKLMNLKTFFFALAVAIVGWLAYGEFGPAAQRDFFECGSDNTLVACPVGETPDAATHGDCRAVGDGDTTLDVGTCS